MMRALLSFTFIGLFMASMGCPQGHAQVPIGSWRDHFPYDHCISVTHSKTKVYAATRNGIIVYNNSDNSVEKLNKINALSGIGISKIRYSQDQSLLVVCYRDGMIDVLSEDRTWSIKDIKSSSILASKTVNGIDLKGKKAYLSCGFGIVVLDLSRKEVLESYLIGNNSSPVEVHRTSLYKDSIFAATEEGIYKAPINSPNLADFQNWTKTTPMGVAGPFKDIVRFDDRLFLLHKPDPNPLKDSILQYANGQWSGYSFGPRNRNIMDIGRSDQKLLIGQDGYVQLYNRADSLVLNLFGHLWRGSPQPEEALFWKDKIWIADRFHGLLSMVDPWTGERILPNGPKTINSFEMETSGDHLWVATGAVTNNWDPLYLNRGILHFNKNQWESFDWVDNIAFDTLKDPVSVAIDPNDPEHAFIGTWGNGLIEMQGGRIEKIYGPSNSSLNKRSPSSDIVAAWGCSFDQEGNLWVTNSFSSEPVHVLTPEGAWQALSFGGAFGSNDRYAKIMCTSIGQKWVILPKADGILVFETNGTPTDPSDDEHTILDNNAGSGGLPSKQVISFAEDKDQEVWVGTGKGVAVFYTPDDLLSQRPSDAEEVLVDYDGFLQPLLENEEVTSITVDGADQKWFGTSNSGVFQQSPNGKEQLNRFSENTSPLISDGIKDIEIHPETGEVFFGTDQGIISYRAQATKGKERLEEVVIYPNPVEKDHSGPVAIRGLPSNSTVRITDISGDLVFRGRSKGGQATWDGTDTEGLKVRTGVYLVFVASPGGEQSLAGKLMFFH